jgi:hypothetical protein
MLRFLLLKIKDLNMDTWVMLAVVLLAVPLLLAYAFALSSGTIYFSKQLKLVRQAKRDGDFDGLMSVLYDLRMQARIGGMSIDATVALLSEAMRGICHCLCIDDTYTPALESRSIKPSDGKPSDKVHYRGCLEFFDDLNTGDELDWIRVVIRTMVNLQPTTVETCRAGETGYTNYIVFEYPNRIVTLFINIE